MGTKIELGHDWFKKVDKGPAGEKFQTEWWKLPNDTKIDLQAGENAIFSKGSWGELVDVHSHQVQTTVLVSPVLSAGISTEGDVTVQHGAENVVYGLSGNSAIQVKPIGLHSYLQVVNKPTRGR